MILRFRSVLLSLSAPSIVVLASLIFFGVLTIGARESTAQSQQEILQVLSDSEEGGGDAKYEREQEIKITWARHLQIIGEKHALSPAEMATLWGEYVKIFRGDSFKEGESMADTKLAHWQGLACLNLLESSKRLAISSRRHLGRVIWDGEVMEPVLIWKDEEGNEDDYIFRNCSDSFPAEIAIDEGDLEIYNSSLVARFARRRTGVLKIYQELEFLGYDPADDVELSFRGEGSMLEAWRLDDAHVEITVEAGQILDQEEIAVLLVATRKAMREMDLEIWDVGWGTQTEDPSIEREIIWLELTSGGGRVIAHPPVRSFNSLSRLVGGQITQVGIDWEQFFNEDLEGIMARAAFSLIVAEGFEHYRLIAGMANLARHTNKFFDVGTIGKHWRKIPARWKAYRVLDGAMERYWNLIRFYDLAVVMPHRIAGKLRRNYYESMRQRTTVNSAYSPFVKSQITLGIEPEHFQVVNAVYQDQAVYMARMMDFLGCLLDDVHDETKRGELLRKGLRELNISSDRFYRMNVGVAFQDLFQGFSLPTYSHRFKGRNFLRSIIGRDPEMLDLVRSLKGYLKAIEFDLGGSCEVVLIPDEALFARPPKNSLLVVSSLPIPLANPVEAEGLETANLHYKALVTRAQALSVLRELIYLGGARYSRRMIEKGYKQFDLGNALLRRSSGEGEMELRNAARAFNKANDIFIKVKRVASRNRMSKISIH